MQDGRSDGAMAIETMIVEELSSQCPFASVKSEPAFGFELPGQMPNIGQGIGVKAVSEFRTHKTACLF